MNKKLKIWLLIIFWVVVLIFVVRSIALTSQRDNRISELEEEVKNLKEWKIAITTWVIEEATGTVSVIIDEAHENFKKLAESYGFDASMIREVENHHSIREWVVLCITVAETGWGNNWAGVSNLGNIWNTENNPRANSYSNIWASLDAIGRTLNNQYLWKIQTLGCLSNAGNCAEKSDTWKRYAMSKSNWEKNMVSCLSYIYGQIEPSTFNIRRQ